MADDGQQPAGGVETPDQNTEKWYKEAYKSAKDKVTSLGHRFKVAYEESKKGSTLKEKFLYFTTALFSKIEKLDAEEEKIKTDATIEAGTDLTKYDTATLVGGLMPSVVNDGLDAASTSVVSDILTTAVDTTKQMDTAAVAKGKAVPGETAGKITKNLEKLDPASEAAKKPLTFSEKKLLSTYGLQVLVNMRNNEKFDTKSEFLNALTVFQNATKGKKFSLDTLESAHVKELLKLSASDYASLTRLAIPLASMTDSSFVNFRSDKHYSKYGEKIKNLATITDKAQKIKMAEELQASIAGMFKGTPSEYSEAKPSLSRALILISDIVASPNKTPTNEQLVDLIFAVDSKDLQNLIDILNS